MPKFEVAIIGIGPCGISSAIYLKRYGHSVCLFGNKSSALSKAHLIENYYGIESITGEELFKKGIEQANRFEIPIFEDEVISIEMIDNGFKVVSKTNEIEVTSVLLALGTSRPSMPMASKFDGNGVSYCATCDGFFYRKKKACIIGSGEYMHHEYDALANIIKDLTIFTNGEKLSFIPREDVKVVTDKIVSFNGETKLESISTANDTYLMDGCFIAIGTQNAFSFSKHLGLELNNQSIVVDKNMMTNIPGIFAGGDCIEGLHQVVKAAADGAIAAVAISKYIKENK